ncbi:DUF881 domain-containing protein [Aquibacillus salsiterrae]|uniref:DUF881 domain-containing protein n=1 Tax=Aquibacillus salsiterrae TaxID=2950439 RepID=A0A9X3WG97_9BACI|nr:DUF881 domain-containing protein [Aquibacillus salsiterrae]MDC3416476.1 DUF881 domain-containing protein [Aquibacillus salsiterrae]
MKGRQIIIISLVCAVVGLMAAIQFQSVNEPTQRDTRDLFEVRTQIQVEQKKQQQLYQQIAESEKIIEQYQEKTQEEQIATLKNSIEELKRKAGLTEITGSGVLITIKPIFFDGEAGQLYPTITPELLHRLVNELNSYGATDIAIENERIINTTPIRYVNGETYVNNHALRKVPVQIKVLSQNPSRLLDYIQVSKSKDYFAIENLDLIANIKQKLVLPKYEGMINVEMLEVNEIEMSGEQ